MPNSQLPQKDKPLVIAYGHPKIFGTPRAIYRIGTLPVMEMAIKAAHKRFNNAITDNRAIVVGNGASQLLVAAINALKSPDAYAEAPYFARFPGYTEAAGKTWTREEKGTQIITVPSNPLNKAEYTKTGDEYIFDMCYNWPTFIDQPLKLDEDIVIFSMSKATGDAALRVGWALVKDPNVAIKMINYIEMTTGGVSLDQQEVAATILDSLQHQDLLDVQKKLKRRWERIFEIEVKLPFVLMNRSGQFLLLEGTMPETLVGVAAESMGLEKDSCFRLNLGCSDDEFEKLMAILEGFNELPEPK